MTERNSPPTPIAEAISRFLERHGMVRRVAAAGVVAEWADLVGPQIAAVTEAESVTADGVLRVRVASAPWAQELRLMSPRILAKLNQGRSGRIREIRWLAVPSGRPAGPPWTDSEGR